MKTQKNKKEKRAMSPKPELCVTKSRAFAPFPEPSGVSKALAKLMTVQRPCLTAEGVERVRPWKRVSVGTKNGWLVFSRFNTGRFSF